MSKTLPSITNIVVLPCRLDCSVRPKSLMANNVWASNGRDRQQTPVSSEGSSPALPFNSQEVRDCLKNGIFDRYTISWPNVDAYQHTKVLALKKSKYQDTNLEEQTTPDLEEPGLPIVCLLAFLIYSTPALSTIAKNMSNGKDFYVELRKQVTALQQSGERAGM